MSDRLREAIDSFRNDAAKQWLYENPKVEVLLAAARRFLALTETGQRVEWCETHGCTDIADESHRGGDYVEEHCMHGEWIVGESPSLDTWNCHIVPVHVIPADYLTEEE